MAASTVNIVRIINKPAAAAATANNNNNFFKKRNPHLAKWNILFDKANSEWISFKPQLGLAVYPCYVCRNMFASKTSFLDHVNRRTIVLNYSCPQCAAKLTFFNSCSFLLHARDHFSLNKGFIDLDLLELASLPLEYAGFTPHPDIPLLYDVEENTIDPNCYINSQFYSPLPQTMGQQIIAFKPNDLLFRHQTQNEIGCQLAIKQVSLNVPKCQFISVQAHKNLKKMILLQERAKINIPNHAKETQVQLLKEPEIKKEPEEQQVITMPVISKIESLFNNVTNKRIPKCSECGEKQTIKMADHFLDTNVPFDAALTCSMCRYIAPTKCSLKAHMRIHSGSEPYVCPECGNMFKDRSQFKTHLDDVCFHLAKQVKYKCPGKRCGKTFSLVGTYVSHFESHLQLLEHCNTCKLTLLSKNLFEQHSKTHPQKSTSTTIYKCLVCDKMGTSNYVRHIMAHVSDRSKCIYVHACRFCHSYFRSPSTYASHLFKCSKIPQYSSTDSNLKYIRCKNCQSRISFQETQPTKVCHNCQYINYLPSYHSLEDAENDEFVEEEENINTCLLCGVTLTTNESQSEHEKNNCKYSKPFIKLVNLSPDDLKGIARRSIDRETTKSPSLSPVLSTGASSKRSSPQKSDDSPRKNKRKKLIRTKRQKESNNIEDLQADDPTPFNGTYYCKLCPYTDTNRSEFHVHIITHRDISTSYQCMECGECFVVKPSLIKHLQYYHYVSDVVDYFSNNNCYDEDAIKRQSDSSFEIDEPLEKNQCRVCRVKFETELDLSKHFRVHGMAFLKSATK